MGGMQTTANCCEPHLKMRIIRIKSVFIALDQICHSALLMCFLCNVGEYWAALDAQGMARSRPSSYSQLLQS